MEQMHNFSMIPTHSGFILGHLFNFAHAPVPSLTYCLGVKMLGGGGAQTHTNYLFDYRGMRDARRRLGATTSLPHAPPEGGKSLSGRRPTLRQAAVHPNCSDSQSMPCFTLWRLLAFCSLQKSPRKTQSSLGLQSLHQVGRHRRENSQTERERDSGPSIDDVRTEGGRLRGFSCR